jgi:hypothetical protein
MKTEQRHTTYLAAGLGALPETRVLLDLWETGMSAQDLYGAALGSGKFPRLAARRLKNLVLDCFGRRFLVRGGVPALWLKTLAPRLTPREFDQIAFVHTCRANSILASFVTEVYWPRYSGGQNAISNDEAREFVIRINRARLAGTAWADSTVRRVAGYLTGACADFGLLERGVKRSRKILPYHVEPGTAAVVAYDLHLTGLGDNALVGSPDWKLFGITEQEVIAELKRLALRGLMIVQAAGTATRISWKCNNLEELADALAQG